MALIDLARATDLIPNWSSDNDSIMNTIIDASETLVKKYCNRDFELTTYDELYDGTGDHTLLLNQYPITKVLRISYGPIWVVQIQNTDQDVSRASFRMAANSDSPPKPGILYLVSSKNGSETTIQINCQTGATSVNGVAGSTYTMLTLQDLATAIATFSAYGWTSNALGRYTNWAIDDLRPPQGGNECRWFGNAFLKLQGFNVHDFEQNPDVGEIVSPITFSRGYRNFRVVYEAGYESIPEPIQQATAALAVSVFQARGMNPSLTSESLGGYSYTRSAEQNFKSLDLVTRYGLYLYRNQRIAKFKAF